MVQPHVMGIDLTLLQGFEDAPVQVCAVIAAMHPMGHRVDTSDFARSIPSFGNRWGHVIFLA